MEEMITRRSAALAANELDMATLDEVVGGEWRWNSVGVYGTINATGPNTTDGITVAIGIQTSWPFITGGLYKIHGDGVSTGASVSYGGGLFVATGNADSHFLGTSYAGTAGLDFIAKAAVEGAFNDNGGSVGLTLGWGIAPGVQVSVMKTETTPLFAPSSQPVPPFSFPTTPQEYAAYLRVSQSSPLDRYEPMTPELRAAINAGHAGDQSPPLDRYQPDSPGLGVLTISPHTPDDTLRGPDRPADTNASPSVEYQPHASPPDNTLMGPGRPEGTNGSPSVEYQPHASPPDNTLMGPGRPEGVSLPGNSQFGNDNSSFADNSSSVANNSFSDFSVAGDFGGAGFDAAFA